MVGVWSKGEIACYLTASFWRDKKRSVGVNVKLHVGCVEADCYTWIYVVKQAITVIEGVCCRQGFDRGDSVKGREKHAVDATGIIR